MYVTMGTNTGRELLKRTNADGEEEEYESALSGPRTLTITPPEDRNIADLFVEITAVPRGIWFAHNQGEEVQQPAWVESDIPGFAELLCAHYGLDPKTAIGAPKDVEETHWTEAGPPGIGPDGPVKGGKSADPNEVAADAIKAAGRRGGGGSGSSSVSPFTLPLLVFWAALMLGITRLWLRTDAGKDFQSRVMGDTASTGTGSYAAANYIALTANTTAPAAGDTTLTAEITTAGGGLIRAQATYAHTAGASTYTLTKTFTTNGSDSLPVTVGKIGVFNASSSGTMVFETLVSPTATLSAVGDQLTITETVTI